MQPNSLDGDDRLAQPEKPGASVSVRQESIADWQGFDSLLKVVRQTNHNDSARYTLNCATLMVNIPVPHML